jgi:hypothetical protein
MSSAEGGFQSFYFLFFNFDFQYYKRRCSIERIIKKPYISK